MHDSFTPLGGLAPLVNIMLGEVIFGRRRRRPLRDPVFVVLAVFIAGLMVGRTPEYLGKKIEAREMQLAMFYCWSSRSSSWSSPAHAVSSARHGQP